MAQYVLSADVDPEKPALEIVGANPIRLTYGELRQAVETYAAQIADQTSGPSDRVLLRLGNKPDCPISYLAAIAVGRIPIVTSAKLTAAEVEHIVDVTQPALTVCDPDLNAPKGIPILQETEATFEGYEMGDPNRGAYIVFTSGTSGKQMPVLHAHRAIWARRSMFDGWTGLTAGDRFMHAGAFNWTYTMGTGLMDPWTLGATALIPADGTPTSDLPNLMAEGQATIFAASPGVYRRLSRTTFPAAPHLRYGLSAGEKLPKETRQAWEQATYTKVHEAYGMSECSTFISGSALHNAPEGTLGFGQPGRQITVLNVDPGTQIGEIAVHRDDLGLMLGYFNAPDATAAKFDGPWFRTGDLAQQTPDGAFHYKGRANDMMNAGGHRVSPIEVEAALAQCSEITEVACAEVRLKYDLSLIAAFYVAPNLIDEDEIKSALATRLADYKIPRLFVPVSQLPRGNNNKLLRQKLRQDWEAAHGQA
ncbi:class I adenylate-forming enzyme family protein [Cognatiyoonia sp.]|uniref:class I adenylate-forming enzyme family protein n=1 Tax=Cognatiyoonia sp. TaxID=2211652 RepID=UPI003F6A3D8E